MYTYRIRTDRIEDEENTLHTVYGIEVLENGKLLKAIPDVFTNSERAENFIALLNSEKLELIHLPDVIEDELG